MAFQDAMTAFRWPVVAIGAYVATLSFMAVQAQGQVPSRLAATLVRPTTPAKATSVDGFLRRWLLLEPIPTKGPLIESVVRAAVLRSPLVDQLSAVPRPEDRLSIDDTTLAWHAVDTTGYNVNLYHFAHALGKPTSNVIFWAVTVVDVPRDMTGVRLAIGSNAASIWWVDGVEVISLYNDRQTVIDDGVSRRLTLKKGPLVVRAAIVNGGGATDFCARFLDDRDRPINGLTVDLTLR